MRIFFLDRQTSLKHFGNMNLLRESVMPLRKHLIQLLHLLRCLIRSTKHSEKKLIYLTSNSIGKSTEKIQLPGIKC